MKWDEVEERTERARDIWLERDEVEELAEPLLGCRLRVFLEPDHSLRWLPMLSPACPPDERVGFTRTSPGRHG